MRALVHRMMSDGSYDDPSLSNRAIIDGTEQSIYYQAKVFASGRTARIQMWYNDDEFWDTRIKPDKVVILNKHKRE